MTKTKRHFGYFVIGDDGCVMLFHRNAASDSTRLLVSTSKNGTTFSPKEISAEFDVIGEKGQPFGNADSFRAGHIGKKVFLTYFDHSNDTLRILRSTAGTSWKSVATSPRHGHPTVLVDTDSDITHSVAAFSASKRRFISLSLTNKKFSKWNDRGVVLEARPKGFDTTSLSPLTAEKTKDGIVLVYTARNRDGHLTIGAALFDAWHPETMIWRSASPIWTAPADWLDTKVTVLGGANVGKYYFVYFQKENGDMETFPMSRLWETYSLPSKFKTAKRTTVKNNGPVAPPRKISFSVSHRLDRHVTNPILCPRQDKSWEAFSAFNAAALLLDMRVHLLYRAQGHDGISVLGHASTEDGIHITERSADPVFVPSNPFDVRTKGTPKFSFPYVSGGGWGGCEDPRLTRIADRIYMTYVAFNGSCPPGVALTSIATEDFGTRWDWQTPRLISRPNQTQKNWVIFPEKIRGKYAVIHTISPEIGIAYLDSLDDPDLVIDSTPPRPKQEDANRWDNIVRGVGAPPIRTDEGWLVLYHAMDSRDPNRYKVGAMLLHFDHPEIVLARSPDPILEPEAEYENHGHKQGVVYVCGATVKEGTLFVYYGASDKTLAVATANLHQFVASICTAKPPELVKVVIS